MSGSCCQASTQQGTPCSYPSRSVKVAPSASVARRSAQQRQAPDGRRFRSRPRCEHPVPAVPGFRSGRGAMVPLGSPLVLASQATQVSEESTRRLRSTASRLTGRPPPPAGTLPLEPDVQAYLGPTLLPLVELAAGGEPVAVLARPAARREPKRLATLLALGHLPRSAR